MTGEFDFDLSQLVPRKFASDRGPRIAFGIVVLVGVVGLAAAGVVSAWRGVSVLSIAVGLTGVGFVIVGVLVLQVQGTWIRRIRIDSSGLQFELTNSKTRSVAWNDPKIHIFLWDRSGSGPNSPGVKGLATRYGIGSWDNIGAPGVISKDTYATLLLACRAHGLVVTSSQVTGSPDAGAIRTEIRGRTASS